MGYTLKVCNKWGMLINFQLFSDPPFPPPPELVRTPPFINFQEMMKYKISFWPNDFFVYVIFFFQFRISIQKLS